MGLHERIKERRFLLLYRDKSSTLLETYAIRELPTTLVVDTRGIAVRRFEGFAPAPALAVAYLNCCPSRACSGRMEGNS